VTWIQARPPIVFAKFFEGGSIGIDRLVSLPRCWEVSSPLDSTFRAKLSVMFKGRLLHRRYTATSTLPTVTTALSNVVANTTTTLSKPGTTIVIDHTRVRGWLLLPISMISMRLGVWREMRSDRRQSEVVLKGDLGWIVGQRIWEHRLTPAVGWFWCAGVVVVGASVPHDVDDGLGMFFAVQRDSVRCLTLLIVADGGLHVRFESSTRRESLMVLQLLHYLQRHGDDAGWPWPSLLVTLWCISSTSSMVQTPRTVSSRKVSSRDLRV
jgi:hypothetical protein